MRLLSGRILFSIAWAQAACWPGALDFTVDIRRSMSALVGVCRSTLSLVLPRCTDMRAQHADSWVSKQIAFNLPFKI